MLRAQWKWKRIRPVKLTIIQYNLANLNRKGKRDQNIFEEVMIKNLSNLVKTKFNLNSYFTQKLTSNGSQIYAETAKLTILWKIIKRKSQDIGLSNKRSYIWCQKLFIKRKNFCLILLN